jgi:hypothetical protein
MRARHDHARTARRAFCALAVVAAPSLVAGSAGADTGNASKPKTPLTAFESFAFEFELTLSDGSDTTTFSMHLEGLAKGPRAQDCEATVSFGSLDVTRRAVVVGNAVWIDDGDGLKKATRRDFDWEGECPSSPEFWADFPFEFPGDLQGTTETRDGHALERVDLLPIMSSLPPFIAGVPDDVDVERAIVWQSKRHDFLVGLDLAFGGHSEATCREVLELDADETAPATCSMSIRLDLSRFDDEKIKVSGGRGSNGRLTRT